MRLRLLLLVLILTLLIAAPAAGQEPTETLTIPVNSALHGFEVSPDGGTVAVFEVGIIHEDVVLDEYLPIRLYDTQTGEMVAEMTGTTDYATSLAFSPDGSRLASLQFNGMIHIWDAESGELIRRIVGTPTGTRLQFMPDGASVVVLNNLTFQNHFVIWDIESGFATRVLGQFVESRAAFFEMQDVQRVPEAVLDFDVAPDGSAIVLVFGTGKVARWDIASGQETVLQAALDDIARFNIRHIEYDGTGARVVFSHREEGTITVMDAQSGAVIDTISAGLGHFAVRDDGESLLWLVQDEDMNTTLHIAGLADVSDVQSFDIELPFDLLRAPTNFGSNIAAADGRIVIGGFPSVDAPQENGILVITP